MLFFCLFRLKVTAVEAPAGFKHTYSVPCADLSFCPPVCASANHCKVGQCSVGDMGATCGCPNGSKDRIK